MPLGAVPGAGLGVRPVTVRTIAADDVGAECVRECDLDRDRRAAVDQPRLVVEHHNGVRDLLHERGGCASRVKEVAAVRRDDRVSPHASVRDRAGGCTSDDVDGQSLAAGDRARVVGERQRAPVRNRADGRREGHGCAHDRRVRRARERRRSRELERVRDRVRCPATRRRHGEVDGPAGMRRRNGVDPPRVDDPRRTRPASRRS